MKKILFTLLIFVLSSSFCCAITETHKITIKEAVNIAMEKNIDIQAARLNVQIEKNNIKAAGRFENPSLTFFNNFGKAGKGNPQQIGASQTIEIGKRGARKNLARAIYEAEKNNIEYLEFDLRMDVREAYTNLLAKKSIYNIIKEQEEIIEKVLVKTQEKYNAGTKQEIDVFQAKLEINQMTGELHDADFEAKTAMFEFNKVINIRNGLFDTMEDEFTEDYQPLFIPSPFASLPSFDVIAEEALDNRADIKAAKQTVEAAKKELVLVSKSRIPDLEIEGGYSYQNNSQSQGEGYKNGAFVGANLVNIPVFYSFKPEIKNAKLKLQKAELNYQSVKNKAYNDLRRAYAKFITSQLALQNYNDEILKGSEELIKSSRKSYIEGKTSLTTLIMMEETYRTIMTSHTNAMAEYYNSWNDFIRSVGNEDFKINL